MSQRHFSAHYILQMLKMASQLSTSLLTIASSLFRSQTYRITYFLEIVLSYHGIKTFRQYRYLKKKNPNIYTIRCYALNLISVEHFYASVVEVLHDVFLLLEDG
jgi:4-amino-4-deoxy-L-arabinose transferase-like glycosyltransferase